MGIHLEAAARLVCRASRYDHITRLLRDELHWLRCRERITFKLCDGVQISPQRSAGLPARALNASQHEHSSLNNSVGI